MCTAVRGPTRLPLFLSPTSVNMRIAIVTHAVSSGDGQGRVNYEVARAALRRGHEVILVSTDVSPALRTRPGVTWIEIPVSNVPTRLLRNLAFSLCSGRWLRAHRHELDAILANGAITRGAVDVNAVHFVHSAWLHAPTRARSDTPGITSLYHRLYTAVNSVAERIAFRKARILVAVSERVRAELVEMGIAPSSITVIPNGVDLTEFRPGSVARREVRLPDSCPLALFVGDLQTRRKNLDTILRALRRTPGLHLAVVGAIDNSPYPALANRLGVAERVHFLGFRRDVPALMRTADVCVCPSRYEPFSLVALEAMASGCPVLTTRNVGAADLIPPGAGIVLDDPEDVEAMAEALCRVTGDADLQRDMSRAARQTAESYSWTRTAEGYLHLLEDAPSLSAPAVP